MHIHLQFLNHLIFVLSMLILFKNEYYANIGNKTLCYDFAMGNYQTNFILIVSDKYLSCRNKKISSKITCCCKIYKIIPA